MAYTEDKAFELVKSAHERERLGHAFLITGVAVAGGVAVIAGVASGSGWRCCCGWR